MIGIIDYGNGNLYNLQKCISKLTLKKVKIVKSIKDVSKCEKLFLPGVGNYQHSLKILRQNKLDKVILKLYKQKFPIFAICIGLHILGKSSQESIGSQGLNIYNFEVKKFPINKLIKIPNINYLNVSINNQKNKFYYSHSYYIEKFHLNDAILKYSKYHSIEILSYIKDGNLIATQFHPELSGYNGYKLIETFINE